ncbi:MAG: hypothetical protein Q4D82_08225, partial [Neisseria sp.]|nr:hypothetical protein [Neisseria sp.]
RTAYFAQTQNGHGSGQINRFENAAKQPASRVSAHREQAVLPGLGRNSLQRFKAVAKKRTITPFPTTEHIGEPAYL